MGLFDNLLTIYSLKNYRPNLKIKFTSGKYTIKTADNPHEVYQALKLRQKVFFPEKNNFMVIDMTPYELDADHLIVVYEGEVIGTYRLRCSKFSAKFYSESEFYLRDLLSSLGNETILELGRACIKESHRHGPVLSGMWRGILKYAREVEAENLFGCVSIDSNDHTVASTVWSNLESRGIIPPVGKRNLWVNPLPKYKIPKFKDLLKNSDNYNKDIPPLFASYLNMGCVVLGEPAHDKEFGSLDFFTFVKLKDLNPVYLKRLS